MYNLKKGEASILDLKNGSNALGVLGGNVYFVMKSTESNYPRFVDDYEHDYSDGSSSVHTTIQSALDACVAGRNDYVFVMPSSSDYDLTATLAMSKHAVHLIGLSSWYETGCNNAVRVEQTAAVPVITVTASSVEIAGFYFKNYYVVDTTGNAGGIILGNSTYGQHIHHNYFAMRLATATNEPMIGALIANTTGDAGSWTTIERNFLQSQGGGSATIANIIGITSASATGTRIIKNVLAIGDTNNTATNGIYNGATKGIVSDNDFYAHQSPTGAGVFTHCVRIHTSGCAYGNRGNVADGEIVVGGTDEKSFVNNMNSVAGGTVDEL